MILKLVQLGDYGQIEHVVEGKECVIGREPSCHIRPDHGKVANRHCRLYWFGPKLMVEDMNSTIGTGVNGVALEGSAVELHDFDDLSAGPVHFLVMVAPTAEAMAERTPDWLAGELARRGSKRASDSNIVTPIMQTARNILSRLVEDEGKPIANPAHHAPAEAVKKRGLSVSDERGVALARVLDRSLIDEQEIRGFQRELDHLIDNGRSNIALHFGNVEHLSSQALSTVLKAQQRCRDVGGLLKICTVNPQVAELLRMTNIQKHIEVYADSGPAIESLWPEPTSNVTTPAGVAPPSPAITTTPRVPPPSSGGPPTAPVELVVDVGKARGQVVPVRTARFIIGRDRRCQLRPNSDTISRVHAVIDQREGKVFVRDYGTKNGTILNGQTLRDEEHLVKDGDRLQVGVLQFRFRLHPHLAPLDATNDDALAAWLLDQEHTDADAPTAMLNTIPGPAAASDSSPAAGPVHQVPLAEITSEVIGGVQVVKIRQGDLDDESSVGPLRYELHTLFDQPGPRRIVLSLENVRYLSSRAVGAILAFFQRLDREGGALRVCCVQPAILPVLDQMRLSRVVDLYASIDEAVSDPWI